jgi:uncharacterized integral membrane protein (TIGR00697 family)
MSRVNVGRMSLVALFVTALSVSQLTATKILALSVPGWLPLLGGRIVLPAASLAIAVLFFASDCYAELYGRREAQALVNVGFVMNFVLLGLVWVAILGPAADNSVDPAAFRDVMAAGTNIVVGSLVAYLVSQNYDVLAFHKLREYTEGRHLWLRNIGSTATSQAIDTVIFITVAFLVVPSLLPFGITLPLGVLAELMLGQYLLKLAIAFGDTPFVYAVVRYVRETEFAGRRPASISGE